MCAVAWASGNGPGSIAPSLRRSSSDGRSPNESSARPWPESPIVTYTSATSGSSGTGAGSQAESAATKASIAAPVMPQRKARTVVGVRVGCRAHDPTHVPRQRLRIGTGGPPPPADPPTAVRRRRQSRTPARTTRPALPRSGHPMRINPAAVRPRFASTARRSRATDPLTPFCTSCGTCPSGRSERSRSVNDGRRSRTAAAVLTGVEVVRPRPRLRALRLEPASAPQQPRRTRRPPPGHLPRPMAHLPIVSDSTSHRHREVALTGVGRSGPTRSRVPCCA